MRLGALEANGTKMKLGVFDDALNFLFQSCLDTTTPEETLPQIIQQFKQENIDALGIASFGPVNLNPASEGFGSILNSPKLSWRDFPLYASLRDSLGIPCAIDTDVNAAALAECTSGAAQGMRNCLYLTVGTGINGGVYSEGQLVHGMAHPDWGHMLLCRHEDDPMLFGVCPYHPNCAEGLASGPALQTRWGMPPKDLPSDHRGWEIEAFYLAQLCVNGIMGLSPEVILIGGGVTNQEALLPLVRLQTQKLINGYLSPSQLPNVEAFIKTPALWPNSSLIGAAILARKALLQL